MIAQGSSYLTAASSPAPMTWLLTGLVVLSGGGLLAGFLTPLAAVAVAASALAAAGAAPNDGPVGNWQASLFLAADALALAMLGPGALSIDAWLFGRREIVVRDAPGRRTDR